jgi:eukaryotic-like serine/threonine-protein kinase
LDERPGDDTGGDATQAMPPVEPPQPGWVLAGRYRVLDRLGAGGMADVFRAHDDQLDRDVAVKVFRAAVEQPGNTEAADRREVELRALAQLSHPNLITLYDANITTEPAFLVTELVVGPDLATKLHTGPLAEELARTIGAQIADALAYVHAHGMVHRDVKPGNILLGTDGPDPEHASVRARLSDFGIVRVLDDARMTAADLTLGTASYLAPEQARGQDVGAAADVYSLGLVLIEALSGQRSFDGPMHEAMAARLVRSPDIPPGLPAPWPGLLAAMTQTDPATRPSAADVADGLRSGAAAVDEAPTGVIPIAAAAIAGAAAPAAAAPAQFEPADDLPPPRRRGVGWAVAVLFFCAVIATGAFLLFDSSPKSATPGDTTVPSAPAGSGATHTAAKKGRNDAAVPITGGASAPSHGTSSAPRTVDTTTQQAHSSAPASHSSAPAHSTAPVTHSAPPSTSAAPPSTSAASSSPPENTEPSTSASTSPGP